MNEIPTSESANSGDPEQNNAGLAIETSMVANEVDDDSDGVVADDLDLWSHQSTRYFGGLDDSAPVPQPHGPTPWRATFVQPSRAARFAPLVGACASIFVFEANGIGIGALIATAMTVVALAVMVTPTTRTAWLLMLSPIGFASSFVVRSSDELHLMSATAIMICLAMALGIGAYGSIWSQHLGSVASQAADMIANCLFPGWWLIADARERRQVRRHAAQNSSGDDGASPGVAPKPRQLRSTMIGLAISLPLLVVLTSLLASSDLRFRSMLERLAIFDVGSVVGRVVYMVFGSVVVMAFVGQGLKKSSEDTSKAVTGPARIGVVVLAACAVLFGAYGLSKFTSQKQSISDIQGIPGVTYSSVGRDGFFGLLAVAAIMLVVLLVVRANAREGSISDMRQRVVLAELNVAAMMLIVADSLQRLWWYRNQYGWTQLRFYAVAAAMFLACCFVVIGVAYLGTFATRRSMLPAIVMLGLATVAVLNIVNPDALIARSNLADQNLARAVRSRVDRGCYGCYAQAGAYEASLGADAWPEVVSAIERGDLEWPHSRQVGGSSVGTEGGAMTSGSIPGTAMSDVTVSQLLCVAESDENWLAWNRARVRARSEVASVCS